MTSRIDFNSPSGSAGMAATQTAPPDKVTGPSFAAALKKAQADGDEKKLKQACRELESVMVYQLIRSMRATVDKSNVMGNSMAMDIYEQMLDEKYAQEMAATRTFGLADTLYAQLTYSQQPARAAEAPAASVLDNQNKNQRPSDETNQTAGISPNNQ